MLSQVGYSSDFWSALAGISSAVLAGQFVATSIVFRTTPLYLRFLGDLTRLVTFGVQGAIYIIMLNSIPRWGVPILSTQPLVAYALAILIAITEEGNIEKRVKRYLGGLGEKSDKIPIGKGDMRFIMASVVSIAAGFGIEVKVVFDCLEALADSTNHIPMNHAIWEQIFVIVVFPLALFMSDSAGERLRKAEEANNPSEER